MTTIHAIFENGVFRPVEPVSLPEHSQVEFEPRVIEPLPQMPPDELEEVYRILGRSYDTDSPDLAARHNEHQP